MILNVSCLSYVFSRTRCSTDFGRLVFGCVSADSHLVTIVHNLWWNRPAIQKIFDTHKDFADNTIHVKCCRRLTQCFLSKHWTWQELAGLWLSYYRLYMYLQLGYNHPSTKIEKLQFPSLCFESRMLLTSRLRGSTYTCIYIYIYTYIHIYIYIICIYTYISLYIYICMIQNLQNLP